MRNLLIGLFIGLGISLMAEGLSNEQKLKAELFKLKVQLSNCQITSEQNSLIKEFSDTLGVTGDFDWNTLTFKEKK